MFLFSHVNEYRELVSRCEALHWCVVYYILLAEVSAILQLFAQLLSSCLSNHLPVILYDCLSNHLLGILYNCLLNNYCTVHAVHSTKFIFLDSCMPLPFITGLGVCLYMYPTADFRLSSNCNCQNAKSLRTCLHSYR